MLSTFASLHLVNPMLSTFTSLHWLTVCCVHLQQLKLFEVQSTLSDLSATEKEKNKECESLKRERETEQNICEKVTKQFCSSTICKLSMWF